MPALPFVANMLKVDLHFTLGTDTNALCRLHFKYAGGVPTVTNLNSLATQIRIAWTNRLAPQTVPGYALSGVVVTDIASATGAQGVDSVRVNGTSAHATMSAATCALLNHSIARRYKGGKPRTYLPSLGQDDLANASTWSGASQAALQTAFGLFVADVNAATSAPITLNGFFAVGYFAGYTLGPASPGGFRKKVPALKPGGPSVDAITLSTVNLKPASQRRRNQHSS